LDEPASDIRQPRAVRAFADFEGIPLLDDSRVYAGPPTPDSIEGLFVAPSFWYQLDDRAVDTLEQQGFVVVPQGSRIMHPIYQTFEYEGDVYFVTTDAGYHYLHLGFSKVLRDLEQYELLPILDELLLGLVEAARTQRDELTGTDVADAADRVAQLYETAAVLAELDVGSIGPLAQQEVSLGMAASELTRSPITGLCPADAEVSMSCLVDFSLFKPRGHYTRNADLERYFRSMSLLGNEAFIIGAGETMQLGALATRVLVDDPELLQAWRRIYEPTAFLVGLADDYSPLELAAVLDEVSPDWRTDPTVLTVDTAKHAGELLAETRSVGIDPENASVRIMGVRFVIDSYIYDQLRGPYVGPAPFGRRYATPLDLVAVMGSGLAYDIMETFEPFPGEGALIDPATGEHWENYDTQFDLLSTMLSQRQPSDWAATVYDLWLYALEPVWSEHGTAVPDFMRTDAWAVKDLQTGLGSYTELKHDTILYAKQSFAAESDFQPIDYPEPRHWVEPNPVAWHRMGAVVQLLADGLTDRDLLPSGSGNAELLEALSAFYERLARLAEDELAGRPISGQDNLWLASIGSTMESLWVRSSDKDDDTVGDMPGRDSDSALVADIMRTTYHILEIGTGGFDTLFVLVPDDTGRFQIAKGAVYSYYEFWRDAGEGRLTDEEWRQLLDSDPPERPSWQAPLFAAPSFDVGIGPGESCWTLDDADLPYASIVAYWLAYGRPLQMDWNENGIPCDESPDTYQPTFFSGLPEDDDLFCRDLEPMGYSFAEAIAYWLREGAPDRMDADRNGIPCETIYPAVEIETFFGVVHAG